MYHTHHGPITHQIGGSPVASAMMWDPPRALEQSFIRTKQDSYEGFRRMMDIRTNSSNNTVYADADGNIAYFHGNFVPRRDPQFDYRKPVDGSNPATDWQGLHTVDENILVLNPPNGWIQNCNSTPYTSALEFSPKREDYPTYMSLDRENFKRITGRDGLKDVLAGIGFAQDLGLKPVKVNAVIIRGINDKMPGIRAGAERGWANGGQVSAHFLAGFCCFH